MMKKILNTIVTRWKSESPNIYKKICNLSTAILTVSTATLAVSELPNIVYPEKWISVLSKIIIITTIISLVTKLTVKKDDASTN